MFDLYLTHIIGNAVRYYRSDRTLFDPLFPHVSDTMRNRMWEALQTTTISFDSAFNARTAKNLPLITVMSSEQFYDTQGLAQAAGEVEIAGRLMQLNHIFTSQEATVNIYANTLEMIRLLACIVQAGILTFHSILIKAAFQNVVYVGATPLIPDPALVGEDLSTYGRQMRYAGLHLLEIPTRIDIDSINDIDDLYTIQVQHEDQTPTGSSISGGVSV